MQFSTDQRVFKREQACVNRNGGQIERKGWYSIKDCFLSYYSNTGPLSEKLCSDTVVLFTRVHKL